MSTSGVAGAEDGRLREDAGAHQERGRWAVIATTLIPPYPLSPRSSTEGATARKVGNTPLFSLQIEKFHYTPFHFPPGPALLGEKAKPVRDSKGAHSGGAQEEEDRNTPRRLCDHRDQTGITSAPNR